MVTRYRSTIDRWDVINEPLQADGNLRPSVWMKRIGPDYIPLAFKWGVSDRFSWRGAALAPLLLDADLRRKPAYAAVRAALNAG